MTEIQAKYAEMLAGGLTQAEIARRCGVTPMYVHVQLARAGVINPNGHTHEKERPKKERAPDKTYALAVPPPAEAPDYTGCPYRNELRGGCSILTVAACREAQGRLPCGFFPPERERRKAEGSYVVKEEQSEDT